MSVIIFRVVPDASVGQIKRPPVTTIQIVLEGMLF
jgi:hypothetical protein